MCIPGKTQFLKDNEKNSFEEQAMMIENCTIKPAKGQKGYLLYTMNNEYVFRVYKEDRSFTDYDILHCDLDVTIDSDDAV